MNLEVKKYRAQIFQIIGLAFMTPCGKLVLDTICSQQINFTWSFLLASMFSLLLVYWGIIFILKGEEKLE